MATDRQLVTALQTAAEALLDHRLSESEQQQLLDYFNKASGSNQERGKEALRKITRLPQIDIHKRASASDNTDRVIRDLEDILSDWKPGT